jgi:uncharacterized GH25 family protein
MGLQLLNNVIGEYEMDNVLIGKLSKMVQGHEIWLDSPFISDGHATVLLRYGHNMVSDGIPPKHMVNPTIYAPNGMKLDPAILTIEDAHVIGFSIKNRGNYTVLVDSSAVWNKTEGGYKMGAKSQFNDVSYSGAFHMMAKKIIPSEPNNDIEDAVVHGILELVPDTTFLNVGKDVVIHVLYEGKPLTGIELKVFSKKGGKEQMIKTDGEGKVKVRIDQEGEWMFLMRHRDSTKQVEDEYDEAVFITTLIMETLKP